jgi:hypothetical protein
MSPAAAIAKMSRTVHGGCASVFRAPGRVNIIREQHRLQRRIRDARRHRSGNLRRGEGLRRTEAGSRSENFGDDGRPAH